MSFLFATPDALLTAVEDLAGIGSTIHSANATAAVPTTGVLAAAGDEVSTQIAALFSQHGHEYQQVSNQLAAFHQRFVRALGATAGSYAAAEANAAQTLVNAVNSPARALLGQPLIGGGAAAAAAGRSGSLGGTLANAVSRAEGLFTGSGAAGGLFGGGANLTNLSGAGANLLGAGRGAATALATLPTGGLNALTAAAPLLKASGLTNAMASPAAFGLGSIATSIENLYNVVEPYVAYAFNLASYVVGYLPWVGILAPQINFFYYLFEPIVQSALFNTLDFLSGTLSFTQGLSNFWAATTGSINQFITAEINWFLSFLPPLPPFPPFL